mgnify:CR=1 FL=1
MEQYQQVTDKVSWVGVRHPELEIFDELFPTHNGTTYNSYVVRGQEKTALIDTVKAPFTEEFLEKIEAAIGLDKIDLVVISHTEPDHSGALGRLLEMRPELPVYCSRPSQNFLSQLLNVPFNAHVVSDGEELDLGGLTLRFILAPYLHWPDTIFTYLVEEAILFPCDAFGAHYCARKLFDDEIPDFSKDFYFYFDCIMRPFKDKVRDAVAKVDKLDLKMICPSHGPIRRTDPKAVVGAYRRLSAAPPEMIFLTIVSPSTDCRAAPIPLPCHRSPTTTENSASLRLLSKMMRATPSITSFDFDSDSATRAIWRS